MTGRLLKTERVAEQTLLFLVELDTPVEFLAGQSCDVTLLQPMYSDEKGPTRTFSIASSPVTSKRLAFATRETGSAFKRAVDDSGNGSHVEVDGPWGSFVLHDDAARPAVFLAGGIGITPFRSMIKDAVDRRLPHRMTLLYSNRTKASTAFLSDFVAWRHMNPRFTFVPTLTDMKTADPLWGGRVGAIDHAVIGHHKYDGAIFYAAGPQRFVTAMRGALTSAGVAAGDIRTEEFSGY